MFKEAKRLTDNNKEQKAIRRQPSFEGSKLDRPALTEEYVKDNIEKNKYLDVETYEFNDEIIEKTKYLLLTKFYNAEKNAKKAFKDKKKIAYEDEGETYKKTYDWVVDFEDESDEETKKGYWSVLKEGISSRGIYACLVNAMIDAIEEINENGDKDESPQEKTPASRRQSMSETSTAVGSPISEIPSGTSSSDQGFFVSRDAASNKVPKSRKQKKLVSFDDKSQAIVEDFKAKYKEFMDNPPKPSNTDEVIPESYPHTGYRNSKRSIRAAFRNLKTEQQLLRAADGVVHTLVNHVVDLTPDEQKNLRKTIRNEFKEKSVLARNLFRLHIVQKRSKEYPGHLFYRARHLRKLTKLKKQAVKDLRLEKQRFERIDRKEEAGASWWFSKGHDRERRDLEKKLRGKISKKLQNAEISEKEQEKAQVDIEVFQQALKHVYKNLTKEVEAAGDSPSKLMLIDLKAQELRDYVVHKELKLSRSQIKQLESTLPVNMKPDKEPSHMNHIARSNSSLAMLFILTTNALSTLAHVYL